MSHIAGWRVRAEENFQVKGRPRHAQYLARARPADINSKGVRDPWLRIGTHGRKCALGRWPGAANYERAGLSLPR